MTRVVRPARVAGRAGVPPSKSAMQRAVLCAALAEGHSVLRSPSLAADSLAVIGMVRALGARVGIAPDAVTVDSPGFDALAERRNPAGMLLLDAGESGLALRMLLPVAALFPGRTRIAAQGSLRFRPVTAVEGALAALGARCTTSSGLPPVEVEGPLCGGEAVVDASESSQFLSGLLLALPLAPRDSLLRVPRLVSGGYPALTARVASAFGVALPDITSCHEVAVGGRRRYVPADCRVEGDWSGAAFLLVAGAVAGLAGGAETTGRLELLGLDPRSAQPDRAILKVLEAAGADLELAGTGDGPDARGSRVAVGVGPGKGRLRAFDFDATDSPDLFPPLAALATACEGVSTLRGVSRLAAKESDRGAALRDLLGTLGAEAWLEGDLLRVRGSPLHGGRIDARGDHRIAMAAAVAALRATGPVEIEGADCVAKSWPSFYEDLDALCVRA